jgi:hypothetical protein
MVVLVVSLAMLIVVVATFRRKSILLVWAVLAWPFVLPPRLAALPIPPSRLSNWPLLPVVAVSILLPLSVL